MVDQLENVPRERYSAPVSLPGLQACRRSDDAAEKVS